MSGIRRPTRTRGAHAPGARAPSAAAERAAAAETAVAVAAAAQRLPELENGPLFNRAWSRRDQLSRRLLALGDAGAILFAITFALLAAGQRADPWPLIGWTVLTLPAWILLLKVYKLYDRYTNRISHTAVDDLPWLSHSLLVGALGFWAFTKLIPVEQLTFLEGAIFGFTALIAMLLTRSLMSHLARKLLGTESVLLAGSGPQMHTLLGKINQHPEYGLTPIAMLDGLSASGEPVEAQRVPSRLPAYGPGIKFERVAHEVRPERVIIDRNEFVAEQVIGMIDTCRRLSIKVSIVPDAVESLGPSVEIDAIEGVTLLGVNPPMLGVTSRVIKRCFDIALSSLILLVTAPLMVLMAIAIKLDSRGPVLFAQARVGRRDKRFRLYKFRTMTVGAEDRHEDLMAQSRDPHWLDLADDPRVTRVGRLLRRTSLDELPQFFNVLRLSLIHI